jgi:hypothetical protein
MPVNGLTREARQILGEMELLMHGKTASLNSSGRGGERNPVPQGEAHPPHEQWLAVFNDLAPFPHLLRQAIHNARLELERIKRRDTTVVVREETREEWEARLLRDGAGFEARDVAVKFNCAVQDVTRLRTAAGRDPNLGQVDVRELSKTMSVREIAEQTGMSKSAVHRSVRQGA